jgi:hypothetical protein
MWKSAEPGAKAPHWGGRRQFSDQEVPMLEGLPLALALGGLGAIVAADLYVRTVCELERWKARRRR